MKIAIISGYFAPELTPRAFRTTELVLELLKRGHSVDLFIPYRDNIPPEILENNGLVVSFFNRPQKRYLPFGYQWYKRAYRFICYQRNKWLGTEEFEYKSIIPRTLCTFDKTFDCLISVAAPHSIHWGVDKLLRKKTNFAKKWIADCGDPFMGNQVIRPPFYFAHNEKSFCNRVDYITVPVKEAINAYYPQVRHKIRIIPQGFNMDKSWGNYIPNKIPTFSYAGTLYPGYRDLDSFVDYLANVNRPYLFILYTGHSRLTEKYKALLGDKIEINNFIPRDQLLHRLSTVDFLVNIKNGGNVQKPSKLIDYALAKRPILSVDIKIETEIVEEFMNGIFINQTKVDNIEDYDIKKVTTQFLDLI